MNIYESIKQGCKDKDGSKRNIFRFIKGEFDRFNDGKLIDDSQCIKILQKLIKSNNITLDKCNQTQSVEQILFENKIIASYLPIEISDDEIRKYISERYDRMKNKNLLIRSSIDHFTKCGYLINGKNVVNILKEFQNV